MNKIKRTKEELFCIDADLQAIGDTCITYLTRHQSPEMQQVYYDNNWCIPEIHVTNAVETAKYVTADKMTIDVWFSCWAPEAESAELAKRRETIDGFLRDFGLKTTSDLEFSGITENEHLYQWQVEELCK